MQIKCQLLEKTSKDGKKYWVLYIPDIEKSVFLEPAELKLLKLLYKIGE